MERDRRLALVAAVAIIVASVATIFFAPSSTTIPIPEPSTGGSSGNSTGGISSGIKVVAENLDVPWAIDVAQDGRLFFTERSGAIRVVAANGTLLSDPAAYINVAQEGEAGLLGLALHPGFMQNHLLYIYQTYTNGTAVFNKVVMLTEKDSKIIDSRVVLDGIPASDRNDGGRIRFGPDGKLYIATGDAKQPELAQDAGSLAGKILRINPDGSIPDDNPFAGSPVYSYGHRNVQGLAWDAQGSRMYATDHGESGNDEINLIKPGENYGWPIEQCDATRFEKPVACFNPAIAPAGMAVAHSDKLGYEGDLLVASLKAMQLRKVDLSDNTAINVLTSYGRIRDVVEAPDGTLYVLTSNRDGRAIPNPGDDKILHIQAP
ncbi:PQQ-dependent sugar dehydrogenase [Nitrososphaera viennensis]|uniref:PQQ-dependent sugar dehydrogenase n=2 Tax=Nitrososphaera viennensis TaxID=1034015 RepID=A0A977ID07_9ARCH|nr:PQQ-dependent sugar dehydrogenase [Nitrososphaera viennensis]AIC16623.1 putative PQQ dependent glucose 1-dehydrogenase [Nitrososphaera viennensis EN76]UVS68550.1 PQQ-dependent sugar dehydrogenase [Nitrososphaera viennensis]